MSRRLPSSSTLTWVHKGEIFQFLFDVWDVDRAKRIIKGKPRPIRQLVLEPFRRFVGSPGEIIILGVRINWEKLQAEDVNLDDPLIVAYGRMGKFPIDGWHRIAKGLLKGLKTLPYVGLTQEENKKVHRYTGRQRRRRMR